MCKVISNAAVLCVRCLSENTECSPSWEAEPSANNTALLVSVIRTAASAGDVVWYGMTQYGLFYVETCILLVFLMLENMV